MNFIRKIVQSHSKEAAELHSELKKLLNFSPGKINTYEKAFTHRSVQMTDLKGTPINYERLEFLGDSILGSVIASYLYKKVPTGSEGYLTQMRSKIVSREHLNELGKDLNLIRFVKSKIIQSNVGDNIHGNIFEALIGAIYLDKGFFVRNLFIEM
jgi:ribonuclease-3